VVATGEGERWLFENPQALREVNQSIEAKPACFSTLQYGVIMLCMLLMFAQIVFSAWKDPAESNSRHTNVATDFKAFYCAGATVNAGGNPYLVAPFQRCGTPAGSALPTFLHTGVYAAPLPPYDVAAFRLIALLPFYVAALVWLVLSFAVLSLAVVLVARMSGIAPLGVFAALAMTTYLTNLAWGQIVPMVVGALTIAAFALRSRNHVLAGAACIITLLEPHIGFAVCLAVFLWAPKTRWTIAIGCALFGALSIATVGVSTVVDYFRIVLPLQAIAEAPATYQYSLTWLMYILGASEALAVKIGSVSYVFAAALALWLARAVSRHLKAPEFIAFVPAGVVVFGGPFVHTTQTSISILLGLMLIGLVSERAKLPLLWAGVLLQVPDWFVDPSASNALFRSFRFESMLAIAVTAFFILNVRPWRRFATAAAVSLLYLAISFSILHLPDSTIRRPASASTYSRELGTGRDYTTGVWGVAVRADTASSDSTIVSLAFKIPIWAGLLCIIVSSLSLALTRRDVVGGHASPRNAIAQQLT
jgi:hypothetical protein